MSDEVTTTYKMCATFGGNGGGTATLFSNGSNPGDWSWADYYNSETGASEDEDCTAFWEFASEGILGLGKIVNDDADADANFWTTGINETYGNYVSFNQVEYSDGGRYDTEIEYSETELNGLKNRFGYMEQDSFYTLSDDVESGALHDSVSNIISDIVATLYVNKYSFKQTPAVPYENEMVDVFGIDELAQDVVVATSVVGDVSY